MIPNLEFMKTTINGLTEIFKSKIDALQNRVNNLDADISSKQDLLAGNPGQVVSFDETGKAIALDMPEQEDVITLPGGATATVTEVFGEGPYIIEFTDEEEEDAVFVQSDWNVNDSADPAYVKNRTHSSTPIFDFTWDGNTEGLESFTIMGQLPFYKIAEAFPYEQIIGYHHTATVIMPWNENDKVDGDTFGGTAVVQPVTDTLSWLVVMGEIPAWINACEAGDIIIEGQNLGTIPSSGFYLLKIPGSEETGDGYTSKINISDDVQLDEKFIPSTIQRKLEGSSSQFVGFDYNGNAVAKTISTSNLSGTMPISKGGTGATTASAALTALGAQAKITGTAGQFVVIGDDGNPTTLTLTNVSEVGA